MNVTKYYSGDPSRFLLIYHPTFAKCSVCIITFLIQESSDGKCNYSIPAINSQNSKGILNMTYTLEGSNFKE